MSITTILGTDVVRDSRAVINSNFTHLEDTKVTGPASATDNAVVRFNATTGKLVQNSVVTIGDGGNIVTTIADGANVAGLTINQNDVTNDPLAFEVNGKGSGAKVTNSTLVQFNDTDGANSDWSFNVAGGGWPVLNLQGTGGTLTAPTATNAGRIGAINSYIYNSTPAQHLAASIDFQLDDATAGTEDTHIVFNTVLAGFYRNRLLIGDGINGITVGVSSMTGVVESNGNQDLILQTGNATTGSITIVDGADGNISVSPNGSGKVVLGTDVVNVTETKTPASATATGTTGDIAWDADYIYVCTATNTWKRTAISTW